MANAVIERASFVKDEHLSFLDDLRTSGVTNMFGATPYLQAEFGLSEEEAKKVLFYWIKTFEARGCPRGKRDYSFRAPSTSLHIRRRKIKGGISGKTSVSSKEV